jgi:hypothetical protein
MGHRGEWFRRCDNHLALCAKKSNKITDFLFGKLAAKRWHRLAAQMYLSRDRLGVQTLPYQLQVRADSATHSSRAVAVSTSLVRE